MKKRFEFRLARLLRVRAVEEMQAKSEWIAAEARARASEEGLRNARADRQRAHAELATMLTGGVAPEHLPESILVTEAPLAALGESLKRRRERALTDRTQAERMAADWSRRKADEKALEELEERARRSHRSALAKAENAEMDEVSLMRAIRNPKGARSDSKQAAPRADERRGATEGPHPR